MRRPPRSARCLAGSLLVVVSACDKPAPVPGKDTATAPPAPPESTVVPPPAASTWDTSAGPALLIAGQSPDDAILLLPSYSDTTAVARARVDSAALVTLRGAELELYVAGQRIGRARVDTVLPPARSDSCHGWAHARLRPAGSPSEELPSWAVAFAGRRAQPIAIDSIEGLSPADSAKLAAEVARIASALPGDTAVAFRGLPFVVKKAWRFRLPSVNAVASVVVRNVNQEANPLHEQLLLIAERDTGATSTRYRPVFTERRSGLEETLEVTDLLVLVLLGAERRPTLILARDSGLGSRYVLLERARGEWRVRWASAYAGC